MKPINFNRSRNLDEHRDEMKLLFADLEFGL